MIKLKHIINEIIKESRHETVGGVISQNGEVKSEETLKSHRQCGFDGYGKYWRYNPYTKIVYWYGDDSKHNKDDEFSVENHLDKKYGYEVKSHITFETLNRDEFSYHFSAAHGLFKNLKEVLLIEKTLYHGTIIDNIPSIKSVGLVPMVGSFTKQWYDEEEQGPIPDLTFAADKKGLERCVSAIVAHIAHKLKKDYHDVTDDDILRHGALIKINDGDYSFDHKKDDYDGAPSSVESGDYYSNSPIKIGGIFTGKKMITILKRYKAWPRYHAFGNIDMKYKKDFLIKLAIKKNPNKSKEEILKIINSWDEKTIDRYYQGNINR